MNGASPWRMTIDSGWSFAWASWKMRALILAPAAPTNSVRTLVALGNSRRSSFRGLGQGGAVPAGAPAQQAGKFTFAPY